MIYDADIESLKSLHILFDKYFNHIEKIDRSLELHFYIQSICILYLQCNNNAHFKARQMGHYGMVSVWCASLLTDTIFRVLYFKTNDC